MNRRRIIFWGASSFVIVMLGVWFLAQAPEEVGAWVADLRTVPPPPPPPRLPPAPPPRRVGPCVGLTWTVLEQKNFSVRVGPGAQVAPVPCEQALSVLCFNGSEFALSSPIEGKTLSSRAVGDALCGVRAGVGMRMASVRDGAGVQGKGELPENLRFWVAGEYPQNPWD